MKKAALILLILGASWPALAQDGKRLSPSEKHEKIMVNLEVQGGSAFLSWFFSASHKDFSFNEAALRNLETTPIKLSRGQKFFGRTLPTVLALNLAGNLYHVLKTDADPGMTALDNVLRNAATRSTGEHYLPPIHQKELERVRERAERH